MTTPDDDQDPPTVAARARVETLLERLGHVNLQSVIVSPPDPIRADARRRAHASAIAGGRGALWDEAAAAARDAVIRSYAQAAFSGTWAATEMSASVTRAPDRIAAAAALEEAAMAEVVEDLVDEDTLQVLRATSDELVRLASVPEPMALSALTAGMAQRVAGPIQAGVIGGAAIAGLVVVGSAAGAFVGAVVGLLAVIGLARLRSLTAD